MSPVSTTALVLSFLAPLILGAPALDSSSLKKNGADAQQLNSQFASLKKSDPCEGTDIACVESSFAQCVSGKWEITNCSGGTQCFALPLVNKAGTSITCDTRADAEARISSTGVSGGLTGTGTDSSSRAPVNASGSNSTQTSGATNGTDADGTLNGTNTDSGTDTPGTNDASSDCIEETTVTVTVTRSAAASPTFTASATLAPGFTLPPSSGPNATVTSSANPTPISSGPISIASGTLSLNSTETSAIPIGTINTTLTLSPASASAFISSLSAASPGISIATLSGSSTVSSAPTTSQVVASASPTNVAVASSASASPDAISLSLFTTTPAGSPTGRPASLAAVPTAGGYGYRVRRATRGF